MESCGINPNDIEPIIVLAFVAMALFISLIIVLVKTWLNCVIFHKAGYSWAWGLLSLVPIVHIVLPFVLALGDWPIRKELRRLKDAAKTQTI